jgi:hypothetical protein
VLNWCLLVKHSACRVHSCQGCTPRSCASIRPSWQGPHALKLGSVLLLCALSLRVFAQDFVPEQVVFPITDFKPYIQVLPVFLKFGTGFCLDPDCRFVGTNYHVAHLMGKHILIRGVLSEHLYLDTGPDDAGARNVSVALGSMKYNPAHDLAIYEMRHPIKHSHGIGFNADDLENSPEVDIYAYPFGWNPKRGLVHWHGRFLFNTTDGLLAFSYEEGRVRGGASGGIVVDCKTKKIVGILNEISEDKDRIVFAVPARELSNFVARAQPYLQATLFPKTVFISPVAPDLYPPYTWPRSEGLSERQAEPLEVFQLRLTAQHLADSMHNFTANETFAWGHDNGEPEEMDTYETLLADGTERWRQGKKFYDGVPIPLLNGFVGTGTEWYQLPRRVGTDMNVNIHQAADAVVGGRTVHVFQYAAKAEDDLCVFRVIGLFHSSTKSYDCHGEVWVDEPGSILRISEAFDLLGPWHRFRGVMTYGWLEKDGTKYRVPITIATQAEYNKTYWCRGLFTDYHMFAVTTHLMSRIESEQVQESAAAK